MNELRGKMEEEKKRTPDWSKLVDAELGRRGFLKLVGGTTAALTLTGCTLRKIIPCKEKKEAWEPGIEKWVSSVCMLCPGGCGIKVRVVDGRAVKIEGNPHHPVNRGSLCPKGQAGLQVLYHPDRIKGPMRVVGKRGGGRWDPVGWDEAIEMVASKLREIREREEAQTVVLLSGKPQGLLGDLMARFMEVYGSPNYIEDSEGSGMEVAYGLMQGIEDDLAVDLEKTNYILSFGSGLLEAWDLPLPAHRAYGYLRQVRPGPKAKIVHIDTRFSMTAAKSDEWIPINPGTAGALALGIAYVMIKEELYDKDFVQTYTFGYEDWTDSEGRSHLGFKNLLLREYRPDRVSTITGVPVERIIRLAKDFGSTRPAIAIGGKNATLHTGGAYTAMAIHSLNALTGSIDIEGGIKTQRGIPFKKWPEVNPGDTKRTRVDDAGTRRFPFARHVPFAIPENILGDKPYQVNLLLLHEANPLFSSPNTSQFKSAFDKIPFIVSFSSLMDESAEYADLILPIHTTLERWQDIPVNALFPYPVLGVAQPVVKPLYDTKHPGDVFLEIGKRMEGSIAEAFPWEDYREVMSFSIEGIFEARNGTIFTEPLEEEHIRLLEARGWWAPLYHSYEDFFKALVEKGGWWDPVYFYGEWRDVFKTPSRKFEFYSQRLREKLENLAGREGAREVWRIVEKMGIDPREDMVYLPHYEPPKFQGQEGEYPLHLNPFELLLLTSGDGANQPWLMEIVGSHLYMGWDSWVEMNPMTSRELGISDGDWVWVESPLGKVKTRARIFVGAMPNVVNIPLGLGHHALGRYSKGRGVNPNTLIGNDFDYLGGQVARMATKVKVYKA